MKDKITKVMRKEGTDLLVQLRNTVELLSKEASSQNKKAAALAKAATDSMQRYKTLLDANTVTATNSLELLKAIKSAQQHLEAVENATKGDRSQSLTARIQKEKLEVVRKETIVRILSEINETTEKSAKVEISLSENQHKGLALLLGPVGPVYLAVQGAASEMWSSSAGLRERYQQWRSTEKQTEEELLQEETRQEARNDELQETIIEGLGKAGQGGGSGADLPLGGGGGRGGKGGKPKGGFGKWLGKLKGFGRGIGRVAGPLGLALSAYDLSTSVDAGRNPEESTVDKAISYGGNALTGGTIGMMVGGPIGAAIGAAIGLALTGITRNWTSFKETMVSGFSMATDTGAAFARKSVSFIENTLGLGEGYFAQHYETVKNLLVKAARFIPGLSGLIAATPDTKPVRNTRSAPTPSSTTVSSGATGAASTSSSIASPSGVNAPIATGAAPTSKTAPVSGSLTALVAKHESGRKGYNAYNTGSVGQGSKNLDLSAMTVGDLKKLQALPKGHADRVFAAGKYQIIPNTLREAQAAMGFSDSDKFTPELQDRIMTDFLIGKKRKPLMNYIKGKSDNLAGAEDALAQEFASFKASSGKGWYDGDKAGNRASVSGKAQIQAARVKYAELVRAGVSEDEAYRIATSTSAASQTADKPKGAVAPSVDTPPVQVKTETPSANVSVVRLPKKEPEKTQTVKNSTPLRMDDFPMVVGDSNLVVINSGYLGSA